MSAISPSAPRPVDDRHQLKSSVARLVEWRPVENNPSLVGRATVRFAGGWTVSSIPIFRRADGSLSARVPSSPIIGPDGTHLRGDDGKKKYAAIISFEGKEAKARWDSAVLAALHDAGIGGAP